MYESIVGKKIFFLSLTLSPTTHMTSLDVIILLMLFQGPHTMYNLRLSSATILFSKNNFLHILYTKI